MFFTTQSTQSTQSTQAESTCCLFFSIDECRQGVDVEIDLTNVTVGELFDAVKAKASELHTIEIDRCQKYGASQMYSALPNTLRIDENVDRSLRVNDLCKQRLGCKITECSQFFCFTANYMNTFYPRSSMAK